MSAPTAATAVRCRLGAAGGRARVVLAVIALACGLAVLPGAPASADPACNYSNPMVQGQTMCRNGQLASPFNLTIQRYFRLQGDGNLVLLQHVTGFGTAVCWAAGTQGHGRYMTYANHRLTIYDAHERPYWGMSDGGGSTINITRTGALYVGYVKVADC